MMNWVHLEIMLDFADNLSFTNAVNHGEPQVITDSCRSGQSEQSCSSFGTAFDCLSFPIC